MFRRSYSLISSVGLLSLLCLVGCGEKTGGGYGVTESDYREQPADVFPVTYDQKRLAAIGPQACAECHLEEVAEWQNSHHAKANRPVSVALDRPAFTPPREITESGVTYRLENEEDKFWLKVIDADGSETPYELVGVIGETPIRQYLAMLPGNRLQTISASYDVLEDRWIDVFQGQDRLPGEWGHWLGQGMNWNANCAYCHVTEYQKGFDFAQNAYHPHWVQQGLACAECHSGLVEHVEAARAGNYDKKPALERELVVQNCATCHSRRDQLTADAFELGDHYHDHFSLSLPDQPGLYHPDGQILDEVFVYASFEMSRMAHAGVHCMDCHNPHSLEHTLPVSNNLLCMRCHEGGHMSAPIIEPTKHSFHPAGSSGNLCVSCHMPQTTYMQVDPRADHGFHSPDPLMTRELGIPNACSSCHSEETLDWVIGHSERWYGEALAKSRQRQRAQAISGAYSYDADSVDSLIELLEGEDIPAWKATYAGLLGNFLPNSKVARALRPLLEDPEAIVRERALSSLAVVQPNADFVLDALSDSSASVRMAAARARAIGGLSVDDPLAAKEWETYLDFNSDRPQNVFLLADRAAIEGRSADVIRLVDRAISLDRRNAQVYQQSAILLSKAKLIEPARAKLFEGWELAPNDANFPYSLGLLAAETGDLTASIGYLEEAVALSPNFYRAWYNLSLAYSQSNQPEKARRAMLRAQGGL